MIGLLCENYALVSVSLVCTFCIRDRCCGYSWRRFTACR